MLPSWIFFVETKSFRKNEVFSRKNEVFSRKDEFFFPKKWSLFGWFRTNRVCFGWFHASCFFFNERSLFGRFWTHRGFLVDSCTNRVDFRTNRVNSRTNRVVSAEKESFWFIPVQTESFWLIQQFLVFFPVSLSTKVYYVLVCSRELNQILRINRKKSRIKFQCKIKSRTSHFDNDWVWLNGHINIKKTYNDYIDSTLSAWFLLPPSHIKYIHSPICTQLHT